MASAEVVLTQMDETLDQLIAIASELKELSKGTVVAEQLEKLQEQQEGLIAELCRLDALVHADDGQGIPKGSKIWARVEDKMTAFSELNEAFIENVRVRKGLIQFEMQQIKKSRKAVAKMRESYTGTAPKKGSGGRKPKINTTS